MIVHVVHAARGSQLQTVSRVRDACRIAHRVTRAYSELRKRGPAGALVSASAYPLMWLSYFALTCLQAGDTVHAGVASMIAPNPVSRPRRQLWRGLLLVAAVVIGFGEIASASSTIVRDGVRTVGTLFVLAWLSEVCCSWKIGHRSGPLKHTMQQLRSQMPGPVVLGGTAAAWPHPSGHFGPLLDAVVDELGRDGISLLVQARDDDLAATYMRRGATRPNPAEPRHLVWLAARP